MGCKQGLIQMKKILCFILASVIIFSYMTACTVSESETESGYTESVSEAVEDEPIEDIQNIFAEVDEYTIIYPDSSSAFIKECVADLTDQIFMLTGIVIESHEDSEISIEPTSKEILIGETDRPLSADAVSILENDSYAVRFDGNKIAITASNDINLIYAIKYFVRNLISFDGYFSIPSDLSYVCSSPCPYNILTAQLEGVRAPSVLVEDDGTIYLYGNGWVGYRNTTGELDGEWTEIENFSEKPADSKRDFRTASVQKYNGAYYMFGTYKSTETKSRGIAVLRSDSPEGPFSLISNGQITPPDWNSIDASLYVDDNGQPWLVFALDNTLKEDPISKVMAAKLSDDLSELIADPIELFSADECKGYPNTNANAPFLYRTSDGQLLVIWSRRDADGVCVGVARSSDGTIEGDWIHETELLYSKSTLDTYDGGYSMVFELNGQIWLALHSPSSAIQGVPRMPTFIALDEVDGTLVLKKSEK